MVDLTIIGALTKLENTMIEQQLNTSLYSYIFLSIFSGFCTLLIIIRIVKQTKKIENGKVRSILSISQFTLYADTLKGRRPSYKNALNNELASPLYDLFNQKLKELVNVETGIFGSDMKVSITNDGPVTIILESR